MSPPADLYHDRMASPDDAVLKALRDPDRGRRNLAALRAHVGPDPFDDLAVALGRLLPRSADPDMALNNLERFLANEGGRQQLPALLEGRARPLEILLQLLNGLVVGSSLALVAAGLALLFGVLHIINFAQGDFFMMGGYAVWFSLNLTHNYVAALVIGVASSWDRGSTRSR